ncbi:MAG: lysophospholipid acyltransferase family protein [Candidatus Omnitrophica bacterium]|nr:lysophospholipid acyltransferase family protein [Candidatus Omnitrophota bacterium]
MMDKTKRKFFRRRFGWLSLKLFTTLRGRRHLKWDYLLGSIVGKLGYIFALRHRRIASASLGMAFPNWDNKKRRGVCKKCFIFIAQSSLEVFYFLNYPKALENIRIEGENYLKEALSLGKGVIGLTAHLGNFPLMSMKLAYLGYVVNVMARPMRDEKVGDYLHNLRTNAKVKTILSYPRKECVNQTLRVLRNNEIVIIQMDQNFGTGGVWVKFFNRLAATPVGPIVFSLRTGAVILPMYIRREGLGRHCIKIFSPFNMEIKDDKDETILVNAIRITKLIENWIVGAPWEWGGWIHRRWKSEPSSKVETMKLKVQKD